ncbi:MAG: LPS assembly protein LptD [Pseudomonadota bacterium]
MRILRLLSAFLGFWAAQAGFAPAQTAATLIADRVTVDGKDGLLAEGNVEVFHRGVHLRAPRIAYDAATDRLTIEGPIHLIEGENFILIADMAELSPDLTNGILRGARIVLDRQLQLAAAEIRRSDGRYLELEKTVASSCQVCVDDPVQLWQIMASRIIHDQEERQLYFHDAQFRVMGVPIAYLPRLRLPDPTVKRATGFLIPRIRSTNRLGTGVQVPYFITIGDSRDLTLTPYVTTTGSHTLFLRYREALRSGNLQFQGALTRDDLTADDWRGYLFAAGQFQLPRDFKLNFDFEQVSDINYLVDYALPQKDRLDSEIELTRTRADRYLSLNAIEYTSLRQTENNDTLPTQVANAVFIRRFNPAVAGGRADFRLEAHALERTSSADIVGRDVRRLRGELNWSRGWAFGNGMVAGADLRGFAEQYYVEQDSTFASSITRSGILGALQLRWPLERTTPRARHIVEPVIHLAWGPDNDQSVPNEDSVLVEFDEGNLFSLNRFAGTDRIEDGLRASLGANWTRFDPDGWSLGVTAGRVFRIDAPSQFTSASGLGGRISDWLVTTRLDGLGGTSLVNRAVFNDEFNFAKNELQFGMEIERARLKASYVWMEPDLAEGRPTDTSELGLDAYVDLSRHWFATGDVHYDFRTSRASASEIGLGYRNECVTLDFSVSRRFASSTNVEATTDFGLSVVLNGFGQGNDGRRYRRSCGK